MGINVRIMHMFHRIASAVIVLMMAGCAPPSKKMEEPVFFPPPPELPRVQYLTFFTGLKDIKEQSAFDRFIMGERENRRLDKPYGVDIHDGKIYVCDTNDTVIVFDLKAGVYGPLKGARGPGKLIQPLNISIEEDGTKYVTDPVRGQVVVFDNNDQYVKAYGIPGHWKPVDAVAFEDRLYVADNMNGVVKVFDKTTGEMVKTIGDKGDSAERLDRPTNVAFDRDGDLYVTDISRFQIIRFDRDGHFKAMIGKLGDSPGFFARPKGLALDREGRLYAVDAAFNNVQVFNRDGRILLFFGEGGTEPGNFLLPAKVAIDYDDLQYFQKYVQPGFEVEYLILVTSQFGDRMVNVFGYGKEKGKSYPNDEELLKVLEQKKQKAFEKQPETEKKDEATQEQKPEKADDAAKP